MARWDGFLHTLMSLSVNKTALNLWFKLLLMRNPRYFFVTLAALILITISIVFISILGYKTFVADKDTTVIRDTVFALPKNASKDFTAKESLPEIKNEPVLADTSDLQQKLYQLEQLQSEIKTLIDNRKKPDSLATVEKIKKLESDIKSLEQYNKSIIAHNRRLEKTVTKLVRSGNTDAKKENPNAPALVSDNLPVRVSNVSLYALNNELSETSDASGTNVLRGSLFVKASGVSSGELMIVVAGPDGKVLINGPWQSGYFDTPDGRKMYSTKLAFDKPEQRLNFSLYTENLKQGNYVLQIFYKGSIIATLRKTLS